MPDHIKDGLAAVAMFLVGVTVLVYTPERLQTVVGLMILFVCWTTASGLWRKQ